MASPPPTVRDEPSLLARLAGWVVREGLVGGGAGQDKAWQLLGLGQALLEPDEAKRLRTIQTWPLPLDESAWPVLGQAAIRMPDTVAAATFPWTDPWIPTMCPLAAGHQQVHARNRQMVAANEWQQPWSPIVLMVGSVRYWEHWVNATPLQDDGYAHKSEENPQPHQVQLDTRWRQKIRHDLLAALSARDVLDSRTPVRCATLDRNQTVPLGMALVAMGTPLPENWEWPEGTSAQWWSAVASGLDEYPADGEHLLPQIKTLAKTDRLRLGETTDPIDARPPGSPWPWSTGVMIGRVLRSALETEVRGTWLRLATDTLVQGLSALPRDRRQALLGQLLEDAWLRPEGKVRKQNYLAYLARGLLAHWEAAGLEPAELGQDIMAGADLVPESSLEGFGADKILFGLSLVEHMGSTGVHTERSLWSGALTEARLVALTQPLWLDTPRQVADEDGKLWATAHWPSPAYLFRVAKAAPEQYHDALMSMAEEWSMLDFTTPPERRRLDMLGRYTQLLARKSEPEELAKTRRM